MNYHIYRCPKCNSIIENFIPGACTHGHKIQIIDGVYQFTDDPAISICEHNLQWLGYENIGINYEPGYAMSKNDGNFGMLGACSRKLSEILGKDKIVLDLGAGLGPASIPLAIAGTKTIAIDISQSMLKSMVERASNYDILNNCLICARMNAYDLKIEDSSIDAIIEIDMLHQVDRPDIVMKEVRRILKQDGVYVRYGCKGLPKTEAQDRCNEECNMIESDIKNYYRTLIKDSGYGIRPFSSWGKADECIKEYFLPPQIIDTDEIQEWIGDINFKLYKIKMRASGEDQLIPDEIHNIAWQKTEEYAVQKFGKDYGNKKRYSRFIGDIKIYKQK